MLRGSESKFRASFVGRVMTRNACVDFVGSGVLRLGLWVWDSLNLKPKILNNPKTSALNRVF